MRLRVLGSRVLVRPHRVPDTSPGGLHLPYIYGAPLATTGIVVAAPHPAPCRVGDHVVFSDAVGQELQIGEDTLLILPFHGILAIVEGASDAGQRVDHTT